MAAVTYKVKSGDNLTKIVNANWDKISGNTLDAKINTLVSLNNIKNKNLIYAGQVLTLSGDGQTSSSETKPDEPKITINVLGLKSDSTTGRDVFASWDCTIEHTAKYKYHWEWDVPNSNKPSGYETKATPDSETEETWADFSIVDEFQEAANWVQIFITPIAENKKDKNGKETDTPYYTEKTAESKYKVGKQYFFKDNPPFVPETPTCEIDGTTLTMKIDEIKKEKNASHIIFQVVKDNSSAIYTSDKIPVVAVTDDYGKVSHTYAVELGSNYKVRAKSVATNDKESGWTEFSDEVATKPSAPTLIADLCRRVKRLGDAERPQAVHLEWTAVPSATQYEIEYATQEDYFDNGYDEGVSKTTVDAKLTSTDIYFDSNQSDATYHFRVRAINDKVTGEDNKKSDPSNILSFPIGSVPGKPTTWSTSESAFARDTTFKKGLDENGNEIDIVDYTPMELNWVHNAAGNSKQSMAELWIKINENDPRTFLFINTTDVDSTGDRIDEYNFTYGTAVSYKGTLYVKINTNHPDLKDATVQWQVRTAGITSEFSDEEWSTERTIYIYEKPTLNLSVTSDLAGTGSIIDTLTSFPFYIRGSLSTYNSVLQRPIGYQLRIVSNDYYVTVDDVGRTKIINPGDTVYSKYFDTDFMSLVNNPNPDKLVVEMSANNLDLESGINYTIYCNAAMSTGLSVNNTHEFTVDWVDAEYAIDADISVNSDAYTALITPYCREKIPHPGGKNLFSYRNFVDYCNKISSGWQRADRINAEVTEHLGESCFKYNALKTDNDKTFRFMDGMFKENTQYTFKLNAMSDRSKMPTTVFVIKYVNVDELDYISGELDVNAYTNVTFTTRANKTIEYISVPRFTNTATLYVQTDMQIEEGVTSTEYEDYYTTYEDGGLVENVTLSVYRREYDGSYKEIATGIPNDYTSVTDPHPALDYARYRFTAKDMSTGALSFWDAAGHPVNCKAVMIQWAEEWSTFDTGENTSVEGPSWSGSLLKLPYNIKISDKRARDKTLVTYVGREHPVSYYGTQLGESSQWTVEIPANDKETIYALRRLSIWSGDVYVREPSGMGFWANVEVSFNKSYNDLKIPVTLSITRVEGGI